MDLRPLLRRLSLPRHRSSSSLTDPTRSSLSYLTVSTFLSCLCRRPTCATCLEGAYSPSPPWIHLLSSSGHCSTSSTITGPLGFAYLSHDLHLVFYLCCLFMHCIHARISFRTTATCNLLSVSAAPSRSRPCAESDILVTTPKKFYILCR